MILRLVLGIVALLLLIAVGFFIFRQIRPNQVSFRIAPTPTPSSTVRNAPKPTSVPIPQTSDENKNIIGISGNVTQPLTKSNYKNSTVITVGVTNVYITSGTKIKDSNNNTLDLSAIKQGTYVEASGVPIEGGIEASEITIPVNSSLPTTGGYQGK